jgi:Ni/Co efflux regulator RcnB
MSRTIRFRLLPTAFAVMALAPLAALAQGGPPQGDDHDRHGPQQQHDGQHDNGQRGGPRQDDAGPDHGPDRGPSRGPNRGQEARQGYDFRQQDRAYLQQHYRRSIGGVDREHRPQFEAGREIPRAYRGYFTPAPDSLRRRLPPPPAGYTIGYYQGYTVVYDPATFVILSVLDLLSQ